jgi:hypothetical protein
VIERLAPPKVNGTHSAEVIGNDSFAESDNDSLRVADCLAPGFARYPVQTTRTGGYALRAVNGSSVHTPTQREATKWHNVDQIESRSQ